MSAFNYSLLAALVLALSACNTGAEIESAEAEIVDDVQEPADVLGPRVETYAGAGTVFDIQGQALGSYTVDLTRRALESGGHALDIVVHLPDGATHEVHHTMTEGDGNGFAIESDGAQGGGIDLGEGLLTTYTTDDEGTAHASTIFIDDDAMRIVRYELVNGEAVKIFREVYQRTGDTV